MPSSMFLDALLAPMTRYVGASRNVLHLCLDATVIVVCCSKRERADGHASDIAIVLGSAQLFSRRGVAGRGRAKIRDDAKSRWDLVLDRPPPGTIILEALVRLTHERIPRMRGASMIRPLHRAKPVA